MDKAQVLKAIEIWQTSGSNKEFVMRFKAELPECPQSNPPDIISKLRLFGVPLKRFRRERSERRYPILQPMLPELIACAERFGGYSSPPPEAMPKKQLPPKGYSTQTRLDELKHQLETTKSEKTRAEITAFLAKQKVWQP